MLSEEPTSSIPDLEFDGNTVLCRVCGDRASGFHYGVHSCEGCKGFFRRSIQQKIQYRPCTKNQQCNILRINRNRCQYCRLRKCISVGMSRDAVRFGRVPKREKARILAAMQLSSNSKCQEKAAVAELEDDQRLVASVVRAHLETCDFTSDKVAPTLARAREQPNYTLCHPTLACPLNPSPRPVTGQQELLNDFSKRFSPAIRGVVEFAKRIPGFGLLAQDDQVTLLKAGVFEVLLVRLACMFDSECNSMVTLNGQVLRRESVCAYSNARFLTDSMFEFAERLNAMRLNDSEIGLFNAVIVIAADRPGLRNIEFIERMHKQLKSALQSVLLQNHPDRPSLCQELLKKIPDLRTLNTLHSEKLLAFKMTEQQNQMDQQQQQQQQQQQTQIQQINDWSHGRVQLIQQAGPQFVQYNAQGQLIMPGMLQHPSSGAIQVIAAPNKQFQSQQMLTTAHAHKQVISQGQATSFPAGYAAIPTTTNQTLVIGQLGVISSQPNMKQNEMQQTYTSCATGRTVQQNAQTMQFSPWQFNSLPQGITWATPQPQALLTTQNHPIFIRGGPQQDGQQQQVQTPMFIQSPPPQHLQQHHGQTMVQTSGGVMQNIGQMVSGTTTTTIKSQRADIQPKVVATPTGMGNNRQLSILPSGHTIRPNATISTQTTTGIQHLNQMQKAQLKVRPKTGVRQSFSIAPHKSDAANQTNQTKPIQSPQQTINTNKMIITSSGQFLPQIQQQQQTVQVQHLQQQQQAQQQIKLVSMQSPNHQIVSMQSPQVAYQQQQMIKPTTNVMSMSMNSPQKIHIHQLQQGQAIVSSQPQQQITILDRPVIPVVSCAPQTSTPTQHSISPQIQTTVSLPPPIKSDESSKSSPVVQIQETVALSMSENTETTSSLVSLPVTSNNEDNTRDKGLPKALVKPQVLTHVIEGFVIQEADQPFPVNRSCALTDISNNSQDKEIIKLDDEPPNKKSKSDVNNQDKIKCDYCGKCQELQKFKIKKKSKRFCTQECSKMFENNSKTGQLDKKNGKNWECESNGSAGDTSNTSSSVDLPNRILIDTEIKSDLAMELTPINPLTWTVKDVRKFIGQLTDSEEIAADFESHEIDGQALMLLKEDHLIRDMSMKLGPALKIFAKLDAMRTENPELQPPATSQ